MKQSNDAVVRKDKNASAVTAMRPLRWATDNGAMSILGQANLCGFVSRRHTELAGSSIMKFVVIKESLLSD